MKTTAARHQTLRIPRTQRSLYLDALASAQAIVASSNDTDLTEDDAATINARSFRNKGERNFFVNQYRRHARNIALGNPFFL
jgi:hypothetical protein